MVKYDRRRSNDKFSEFAKWLIEQGYSPNTATIYSCTLRSLEREDRNFEGNEDLVRVISPTRYVKFTRALQSWERWKSASSERSGSTEVAFPLDVQLAIQVIEAYNRSNDRTITLSY